MLEMMPGSLIDKTNNNLSDLACAHSTIGQKTDPEKKNIMENTEVAEIPVNTSILEKKSTQETAESDVTSHEVTECDISSQETAECDIASEVTTACYVASQETTDCDLVSKVTTECDDASQEIIECDAASQITTECVVTSQESIEYSVTSQVTAECGVAFQVITECHVSSPETIECSVVSKKISECHSTSQETSECNIPEITNINNNNSINTENNSTNKISLKNIKNRKEKKLLSFLKKHDITEKDLISKLKHFKRQTKDKRPSSVLSLKLNRYYFKSNKPKWSHRRTTEKKSGVVNTYLMEQKQSNLKEQLGTTEKRNESLGRNLQDELETNTNLGNKNESLEKIIPDFKADDHIRNKIKEQLELLRQNKKQITKSVENEPEIAESSEKITQVTTETIVSEEIENNSKTLSANLDDVLLSQGEVGLSIVSVIGGYFSDEEELHHEVQDAKEASVHTEKLKEEPSNEYSSQVSKGGSITGMLLKRELNPVTNLSDIHLIKPSKTNDVTKIKGWRSKQFAAICSPEKNDVEDQSSTAEDQEKLEEVSQKKKTNEEDLATNSIENPLPSTSTGYCEPEVKNPAHTTIPVKADNILKQGENTGIEKNTKSAFVSDMLDTFLINHAALNISYEVPKLVAEEAISKPASEMPIGNNDYLTVVNKTSYIKKSTSNKVLKPKTLAEKRRMLEQDRQKQLLHDMETNESIYLKQLEYCEKRNKNDIAKDVRENLMTKDAPFSRHCWNLATKADEDARQFVIVSGNKIRILGSAGGKDVIVPNEMTRSATCNKENKYNKLHLLNSTPQHVYYKPGPLSKKYKLMKRDQKSESWESHVLKMPKIKLEVCPEQGKRLPRLVEKYLQLHRGEKGFISDELAKFAVSAVRCDEYVKTKFEFDIPYHNGQDKLLVRKQIFQNTSHDRIKTVINEETFVPIPIPIIKKEFSDVNVEDSIKDIMSGMLNCIDNQGLDKVIIKADPDLDNFTENKEKYRPPSPIDPMVQAIIKRPNARRSKTTLELRRLNVQVIEVDVKEEENVPEVCTKDFCKLGCVCKSLRGATSLVPEHCGRESCMLECSCSFASSQRGHHSITLPAGTDLLSASTVVRLQDEVKRKLAKEEREFAQTVIKANNQTIMVGGGARDRQRRVPKVPKKYTNFVQRNKGLSYEKMISSGLLEDDEDFEKQVSKIAIQKAKEDVKKEPERIVAVELKKPVPIWTKNNKKSNIKALEREDCRVKLTKLKLDNVVPWCMVHKLYKCHCGGKAIFESTPIKPKEEQTDDLGSKNEYIPYAPRFQARYLQPEGNPAITVTDITDKYCARTRALATNFYQARNKSQSFKARYAKIRKQQENQVVNFEPVKQEFPTDEVSRNKFINVTESQFTNLAKKNKPKRFLGEIEINDDSNSSDELNLLVPRKNKKVTLVNVEDILNPPKKEEKQKASNPCHVVSAASFIDYDRSFMGILTPSGEWLEKFHKMLNLNLNTVIRQIRLLEWATLVKRHKKGTLQMWFNNKKYNNIILTEDKKRPTRNHMNIRVIENASLNSYRVPEIITSLFNNKLPGVATKDSETYVILVYNGISWEARGTIVLNDTSEMCRQRLGHKPTPVNILDPILQIDKDKAQSKSVSSSPNSNFVIRSTSAISVEVVNRDGSTSMTNIRTNEHSGLEITKIPVANENMTKSNVNTSIDERKETHILAPLPTGFGLSRWFMLILRNDFSVLRISFSNFHIKYTHLTTAIQTARNNQKTVRIRSQDKHSDNPNNFGVYALPNFTDRIFFGPYDNESDHGLETFRYVNGKLVNTKIYNKMRGNIEKNTTGIWYFHSSTVQNNLLLEPHNDNASSGSECSTEMTSVEKAVKPQIEFVDLTENDSDTEKEVQEKATPQNIDPLFNVLSADFTKKVSGDITIEPIFGNISKSLISTEKKKNDIVIHPINDDSARLTSVASPHLNTSAPIVKENGFKDDRKRKSLTDLLQEPPKKQPTLIDSIELDDDDEMPPKLEHFNAQKRRSIDSNTVKQMPALCPINNVQNLNHEALKKRRVIYVITNIPGIGYFEIFLTDKKCMRLNINGKATMFPTINMAITWLHQLFRRHIFFMPSNLKVKFSILESTDVPEMSMFNENFLNGYHMICEKGIFDLIRLTTDDMDNLGFNEQESSTLLAHKCELSINRNIKILGNYLVGPEESNKLGKTRILQIAPKKIKVMESRDAFLQEQKLKLRNQQTELIGTINTLLKEVPERLKELTRNKVYTILRLNPKTNGDQNLNENSVSTSKDSVNSLPAGKVCKIVDGKVVVIDVSPPKAATRSPGVQAAPVKKKNPKHAKTIQPAAEQSKKPFEMLVPIAGLQSPVTVVGMPPKAQSPATSLLLANHKKSPKTQKVVDLTNE